MEPIQVVTLIIFLITIGLVISRVIDSVPVALMGTLAMVVFGTMSEIQAFRFVDWNVIAILISIWLIAGYFGKTGIPQYLGDLTLRISRGNIPVFVTLIGTLAGFISMFIDNVVVVLIMAPIVFHIRKLYRFEGTGAILFIGLCSNFMGTALLLGDLPPQMLHSVTGIEFVGFLWQEGRPSSFLILTATYLIVCFAFYYKFGRSPLAVCTIDEHRAYELAHQQEEHIKDKRFAFVVCAFFLLTVLGMALRQFLGFLLGFIAFGGALLLVLVLEIFKGRFHEEPPELEAMLAEMDWKAIGFYVALFALVGGLEHARLLEIVAGWLVPHIQYSLLFGASILYWVTAPIVGIVEHDAYILTLLYVIKDLSKETGVNPWPLYWSLLWAGTLGSNLTIAGAPALYVALRLGEKEDGTKWTLKQFLSYSVPYAVLSLVICYVFAVLIWIVPFMKG
jgi:Na+/H+ antiporter NhaD/arsenite permease-like protein